MCGWESKTRARFTVKDFPIVQPPPMFADDLTCTTGFESVSYPLMSSESPVLSGLKFSVSASPKLFDHVKTKHPKPYTRMCAWIFTKFFSVVNYYFLSLSLKFHNKPNLRKYWQNKADFL